MGRRPRQPWNEGLEERLVEWDSNEEQKKWYAFISFEEYEDFDDMVWIIEHKIFPEQIDYHGSEDFYGYFVKNGIRVEIMRVWVGGNMIKCDLHLPPRELEQVRQWAQIIWAGLVAGVDTMK